MISQKNKSDGKKITDCCSKFEIGYGFVDVLP
jgi:hypothetical protein